MSLYLSGINFTMNSLILLTYNKYCYYCLLLEFILSPQFLLVYMLIIIGLGCLILSDNLTFNTNRRPLEIAFPTLVWLAVILLVALLSSWLPGLSWQVTESSNQTVINIMNIANKSLQPLKCQLVTTSDLTYSDCFYDLSARLLPYFIYSLTLTYLSNLYPYHAFLIFHDVLFFFAVLEYNSFIPSSVYLYSKMLYRTFFTWFLPLSKFLLRCLLFREYCSYYMPK